VYDFHEEVSSSVFFWGDKKGVEFCAVVVPQKLLD
jgi:hypothetical protein